MTINGQQVIIKTNLVRIIIIIINYCEDQPGEVHRAAHLPPVHLHTLVAIDKDFQNWLSSPP